MPGAQVEGLGFLSQQFKALEAALNRRGMQAAGKAAAPPIVRSMKAKVPVDQGDTKRAIDFSVRAQQGHVDVDIGIRKRAKGRPDTRVHLIEFGSSKQSARPFMRPALSSQGRKVTQRMGKSVQKDIKRVTAKARARS